VKGVRAGSSSRDPMPGLLEERASQDAVASVDSKPTEHSEHKVGYRIREHPGISAHVLRIKIQKYSARTKLKRLARGTSHFVVKS
jgi:hypothetical protein